MSSSRDAIADALDGLQEDGREYRTRIPWNAAKASAAVLDALRAEYGKAYASYRCIPVPLAQEATDA